MRFRVFLVLFLLSTATAFGNVDLRRYGWTQPLDSARLEAGTQSRFADLLQKHPQLSLKTVVYGIEHPHTMPDRTADFYLLMFLCLLLGLIRVSNPKYFHGLWQAFVNPSLSSRQLKDKLQNDTVPNFLMNLFFSFSAGAYLYCIVRTFIPNPVIDIPPSLLLGAMVMGVMAVYAAKYLVIRFSGWVFGVDAATDHYLFNVFLINKILAMLLLPFIVLLAFADPAWVMPLVVVSFIGVAVLFVNRYTRSWQVFGSFFQYSRFHFFTYLCASEIVPLAVISKLLANSLLY